LTGLDNYGIISIWRCPTGLTAISQLRMEQAAIAPVRVRRCGVSTANCDYDQKDGGV
jgi:hypothetical protein